MLRSAAVVVAALATTLSVVVLTAAQLYRPSTSLAEVMSLSGLTTMTPDVIEANGVRRWPVVAREGIDALAR